MKKALKLIALLLAAVILFTVVEVVLNMRIKPLPDRPDEPLNTQLLNDLLFYFDAEAKGELPEEIALTEDFIDSSLRDSLAYINKRYDCADFRVVTLIRLLYLYEDRLSAQTLADIRHALVNFKYWMDQGGSDSMCHWSENHQILFFSGEYLAGLRWPDDIFADGKSGAQHIEMAKTRLGYWMEQRFTYGYTEFYSNHYYPEDIAAMCNIIEFAPDAEMAERMKMAMDLILFDIASQTFRYSDHERDYYVFVSASGRMYEDNKAGDDNGNRLRPYVDLIMQPEKPELWADNKNGFFLCFSTMMAAGAYEVPPVIKNIFADRGERIVKASSSLDVAELAGEGLIGQADHQIMMQMNIEAFTNPPIIANSLKYISDNRMFENKFLNDFKIINLSILKHTGLAATVSGILKPVTDGKAIERANVYAYKTPDFFMSTAMNFAPGAYGDQQHIWTANLANDLSIFTTQPARVPERSSAPNYWVGNGRNPYSVQFENIHASIYKIPQKTGFMEPHIVTVSHAYFPVQFFDEVVERLAEGMIFGRRGQTYIALLAGGPLAFAPFDRADEQMMKNAERINRDLTDVYDLIQADGDSQYWICELSSEGRYGDLSFGDFIDRVAGNEVSFDGDVLSYRSRGHMLESRYGEAFYLDGRPVDLDFARFDSDYTGRIERKPDEINISFGGSGLLLDYARNIRQIINP